MRRALLICFLGTGIVSAGAQTMNTPSLSTAPSASERWMLSAGMGVAYANMPDVVEVANGTLGATALVGSFKAGVQFFGSVAIPVGKPWIVKAEYSYMLLDFNVTSGLSGAPADYAVTYHMPSLVLQYAFVSTPYYDLKAGVGAGYHFGSLVSSFFSFISTYKARGPGVVMELEGNTALSENLFVCLEAHLRYEWVGTLDDGHGRGPLGSAGSSTLHSFAPAVRIGVSYAL